MNTTGKRVATLRKALGLKQVEFSEKIGLTSAAISAIELGKTALTEANVKLICLTFGANEEWLHTGCGEMIDEESMLPEEEKRLLAFFRKLSPKAQDMVIENAGKLVEYEGASRTE